MRPDKVFIGLVLLFAGIAILMMSKAENVSGAGVIIVGPIPIVVASSPEMALLGLVIAAVMLLFVYSLTRW